MEGIPQEEDVSIDDDIVEKKGLTIGDVIELRKKRDSLLHQILHENLPDDQSAILSREVKDIDVILNNEK